VSTLTATFTDIYGNHQTQDLTKIFRN